MTHRPFLDGLPACHAASPEAAPPRVLASLALAGIPAGPLRRALHLGCGTGVGLAIAAAADPEAELWGAADDPEEAAAARALLEEAGLTARVLHASPPALAGRDDLPAFDLVDFSWGWDVLPDAGRVATAELLARRTAPGGVLRLGRSVQPGAWTEDALLQLLRLAWRAAPPGPDAARYAAALEGMEPLLAASHLLLRHMPAWADDVARLREAPPDLARRWWIETEAPAWTTGRVGRLLEAAGFAHLAPCDPAELVSGLDLTDAQERLSAAAPDPWTAAELRDALQFRARRHDLFVRRGGARTDPAGLPLTRLPGALSEPLARAGPGGAMTLARAAYAPLLEATPEGDAIPLGDLAARLGWPVEATADRAAVLIGAGRLAPAASPARRAAAEPACARLNAVLRRRVPGPWRASALLGGAVRGEAARD